MSVIVPGTSTTPTGRHLHRPPYGPSTPVPSLCEGRDPHRRRLPQRNHRPTTAFVGRRSTDAGPRQFMRQSGAFAARRNPRPPSGRRAVAAQCTGSERAVQSGTAEPAIPAPPRGRWTMPAAEVRALPATPSNILSAGTPLGSGGMAGCFMPGVSTRTRIPTPGRWPATLRRNSGSVELEAAIPSETSPAGCRHRRRRCRDGAAAGSPNPPTLQCPQ